jgi:hypothetical protein
MNYSSSSTAGGVLSQSQRSEDTNGEGAGNDDDEYLEDRAANQGPIFSTPLQSARIALTRY